MPHHYKTTILSPIDIEHIVSHFGLDELMDQLIERMTVSFVSFDPTETVIPVRSGFHYQEPEQGLVEWMPLMNLGRQVVVKTVGYHPQNPSKYGLPTIISTIAAYDTATGSLKALMDGVFLTAFRTGAASAVASRFLARPSSSKLGLIGCGAQSISQLHALSRLFRLETVFYYDTNPKTMASFEDRCQGLGLPAEFVPSNIESIVANSEILCTATSIDIGAGPLFHDIPTRPDLHINAVGSDFPGKIEVPLELLKRSFVCPDFLAQAVVEGECQQLEPEAIGADIIMVAKDPEKYRFVQQQLSVFDSTGLALEDQVAMELFMDCAGQLNLGTEIEIENLTQEAQNPYHFLRKNVAVKVALITN